MAGILVINDIIIASLLLKPKKRAPVMEAPDLLVPGNTATDCQIPISKASLVETSENSRLLGFLSEKKSKRANSKLVKAITSNCLDKLMIRKYSKNKPINISGIVAKINKETDFLIPFFLRMLWVFSFNGLATNKITAKRLPICMAMSRLKSL